MLRLALASAVLAALLVGGGNAVCNMNPMCATPNNAVCDAAYFNNAFATSTNLLVKTQFLTCIADSGACCQDDCYVPASGSSSPVKTPQECLNTNMDTTATPPVTRCAALPSTSLGSVLCVNKEKLCMLLNENQCQARGSYCSWANGACKFQVSQFGGATAGPAKSAEDECPAMHPLVIAMLVLMFISLVVAVVVVAVTVIQRQKEADLEEQQEEARAAAQAGRERNVL